MIRERAKTGIEGLDEMLDGGLLVGRPYIVSGTSGTGKSTLAMHFLLEGAANGERALYVAIDEPPNEVRFNFAKFGWNLDGVSVLDGTPDVLNYDKTPVRDVSSERKVVSLGKVGDDHAEVSGGDIGVFLIGCQVTGLTGEEQRADGSRVGRRRNVQGLERRIHQRETDIVVYIKRGYRPTEIDGGLCSLL